MPIRYNAVHNGFWSGFNLKIEPRHDKTHKTMCAPSEDSDQPGHPPSLIRVSAARLKQNWVLSYLLSAQRRLWSDWADVQADLSRRWAQKSFCWFCHDVAQNASSSSLHMQHIYISSHFFTFRIEPNMKLFSHANDIVLRRIETSFDFVKDDCAVGSAVLGKKGYNLSNIQSMVFFHVELE